MAARVWRDATDALGDALAIAVALVDPSFIVLGGGLSAAGDDLLLPVRERVGAALPWRAAPPIELSVLGAAAGRRGAEMLAWRAVGETS
jgi:glucokinase